MRAKHCTLILLAAALLTPAFLWSQGPGGFGGGGRGRFGGGGGGFDPNAIFDRMSKGKPVLVRAELDERGQGFFDRIAGQLGITNGQITREQFQQATQQWAQMRANGGGGFGRRPGDPGVAITPPGGGGGNPADQQAEFFFRRADKNSDGLLAYEEMSERLQSERDKWDTNKDGFIDLSEYKPYFASRMASGPDGAKSEGQANVEPVQPTSEPTLVPPPQNQPEEEEHRPVVIRAGKLPKELPPWWNELDTDEDGQIGLYEWRRGGKAIPEFLELDLNGDGLLTAEEYLKAMKVAKEAAAKANPRAAGATSGDATAAAPGATPPGGPGGGTFGGPGGPGFSGRGFGPRGGNAPPGGDGSRRNFGPPGGGAPGGTDRTDGGRRGGRFRGNGGAPRSGS